MPLWSFHPVASPGDDRWQGRAIWDEVIVEAPTSAEARRLAAVWELAGEDVPQIGNESPSPRSGFDDEKLYWVKRLDHDPTADAASVSAPVDVPGWPQVKRAVRHRPAEEEE